MHDDTDMSFDIDALFDHMVNHLGHDVNAEMEWHFSLESPEVDVLTRIGNSLQDEFALQLQESVEEVDIDGNVTEGPPMLSIIHTAALTAAEVKALADRFADMATQYGATYQGVSCFEPLDEDELFSLLKLDDAVWRLRHYTDCGVEEDAEIPWTFTVVTDSADKAQSTASALEKNDFSMVGYDDEPDEAGNYAVIVFVPGRNNEEALAECYRKIEGLAEKLGAQLEGVQFVECEPVDD